MEGRKVKVDCPTGESLDDNGDYVPPNLSLRVIQLGEGEFKEYFAEQGTVFKYTKDHKVDNWVRQETENRSYSTV